MPALLTHDYFGTDVWGRIGSGLLPFFDDDAPVQEIRNSFLLGNQGPDPLFYTLRTPHLVAAKRFGSLMHHEKADEAMDAFRDYAKAAPGPAGSLALAYLLGFLCHFTLDSTVHPFIYAQQHAICDAGARGLDRRDGSVVHGQIEADLDMMLLWQRRGEGIRTYDYTCDVLKVEDATLGLLDTAYQALARKVYAVGLPPGTFAQGVQDMRLTIRFLYSPRGIKRSFIGKAERLFARHSFAQAMSPRADVGPVCDFDNRSHGVWTAPSTGVTSRAGFEELYAEALKAACDNIAALLGGRPAADITQGLDFEGVVHQISQAG